MTVTAQVPRTVAWARALRLAAMPLLLHGCAASPVTVEMPARRAPLPAKPPRPGFVIAAPHGTTDPQTGDFAAELARRTGFALVVGPDVAEGRLAFYAEIHGHDRRDSANRIEIAIAAADHDLAPRLRTLFELIRDAHLRGHPATPRLEAVIEPAERLVATASASTREGLRRLSARALRVELPRAARAEAREAYLAIVAEFLAQSATLPAGR
jgi:hypothetical protein